MKIKTRLNSGCTICVAIIVGSLILMVGGMAIIVIIKLCRWLPPPNGTNDQPQLRMEVPLLKPLGLTVPVPAGAIQIQRSTDLTGTNWQVLSYMLLATNGGTITLTTFDVNGAQTGTFTVTPGQTNQAEIVDTTPACPNGFYRSAQ